MGGLRYVLLVLVVMMAGEVEVKGQVRCGKGRGNIAKADCVNAVNQLTEDMFVLRPGHYMQEVFGTCKARIFNNGDKAIRFYRDTVTIEFKDVVQECVHLNGHPGAILIDNNVVYTLSSSRNIRD